MEREDGDEEVGGDMMCGGDAGWGCEGVRMGWKEGMCGEGGWGCDKVERGDVWRGRIGMWRWGWKEVMYGEGGQRCAEVERG